MEIAVDNIDSIAVATMPVDELDASNAGEFKRDIAPVLQANTRLVIDLSRLRFVDSSGLGAMLSCLRQLSAKSGDLKLCGMSKQVRGSLNSFACIGFLIFTAPKKRPYMPSNTNGVEEVRSLPRQS